MKNTLEHKSVSLELKDLDNSKRTAVIAHAVYNVIDRVGDISCKGMFDKTWKENKSIDFLFNHDPEQVVGSVLRTFDDEEKAYTEVKFGNWTLGNDVLEMADMGVLKGASFGYNTEKKEMTMVKGKKVRKLKEVYHGETSLLTKIPANPLAGIVTLNKSFELKALTKAEQDVLVSVMGTDQDSLQKLVNLSNSLDAKSDLYTLITYMIQCRIGCIGDLRNQIKYNGVQDDGDGADPEDAADMQMDMEGMKSYVATLEKFVRNTKASDECIQTIQSELTEAKQFLSNYDTASTRLISEPGASRNENGSLLKQLLILKTQINS